MPSPESRATATDGKARATEASTIEPHILLVDDHEGVTRALSAILRRNGFRTTCFNAGRAAVEFAATVASDKAQPIAAIVLDIHMPDMSGLVASHKLRAVLGPAVPIVILSGDCSMENLNSLADVGATQFFSKPTRADQLVSYLRALLTHDPAA